METASHQWRFFRAGGFDQPCIETGEDLLALPGLDQKLWAILSCPVSGLEFDRRTLEHIDTDGDGRIRVPEILAAVNWALSVLNDARELTAGSETLPLSAINDASPEGKLLLSTARSILANRGRTEADAITFEDTAASEQIFANLKLNGDGIVPAESAESDEVSRLIREVIDVMGPEQDRSGKPGVSRAKLDAFLAELSAFSQWWTQAEQDPVILPFGEATPAAAEALCAVSAKIDDYFTRCRLAAYDAKAAEPLNVAPLAYAELSAKTLTESSADAERFPVSRIEAGKPLPLAEGINPAWSDRIAAFAALAVDPVLGKRDALNLDDWKTVKARFAPHLAWSASRAGASVEKLGKTRVREILAGSAAKELVELIDRDKAREGEATALNSLDRLVRYHRHLHRLLNNFVSLRDFYTRRANGIFQLGTLYIDGRSCSLCLPVENVAKHASVAAMSRAFLLYCDCRRRGTSERMTIVAAVTAGDSANLLAGRNGLFYDAAGRDWDATVVHVIENPINIRQAALSPYRRAARFIGEQVQKFAAAKEKGVADHTAAGVEGAVKDADKGKAPTAPFDVGKFAGIFAAIGLAVGAIGTAIATIVGGFLGLAWWKMPIAVAGLALAVSGPSMIIAWFKLRGRTLAPILDANGWAVNTKAHISLLFGNVLTNTAKLPPGTERSLQDPFSKRAFPWKLVLLLILLLAAGIWLAYRQFAAP
ncbi:MAG: hypothetical protein M0042_12555 [Nitrospiraceae bacterium]|nr:hypothetical protein [Nitrospiraceae bacterium]